jgi:uncharacterized protein (DUF58 family)
VLPFDPTELARYGGLTLVARSVVEGFLAGVHKSPFKGFSVEFAEHRPYAPGDEIRRIDWRAYGKTDRYYVKEFEDETNLTAYLVVDASGSMRYRGKGERSKFEYAQHVAASLAYLLLAQLDAVGLVVHDGRVTQHLPPKASAKHLLGVLRTLENTQPGGESDLAPIWDSLSGRYLPRRGMVMLISDAFDDAARLGRAVRHLRHRGHDVMLFHVLAPEEIDFPFTKATKFNDLERPGEVVPTDARSLRAEYIRNFESWRAELRKAMEDVRAEYVLLRTDEPVDRALGAYLAKRAKR